MDAGPAVSHSVNVALRFLLAAFGVALALLGAEGLARLVDGGAFPFLDIYEPDPAFGVRLASDATARIRTKSGRITTVRTNADGFRGPAWTTPPGDGALLLGDSMVFGYGVDDHETMAAQLTALGRPALAAAVPSWGPEESARAAEALVPALGPRAVVFFAHVGNDWLESEVPNTVRSEARDGWLVRRRARAPEEPVPAWVRRSHLWFAVRELDARLVSGTAREATALGAPAAEQMLRDLPTFLAGRAPHRSRLGRHLARVEAACAGRCAVVLAILPMDVQVDASAWAKYRLQARELAPLDQLGEQILAEAAERPSVRAIDLGPTLRAASPGAFLDDDPHLSPRGHRAIAQALLPLLDGPSAPATPPSPVLTALDRTEVSP